MIGLGLAIPEAAARRLGAVASALGPYLPTTTATVGAVWAMKRAVAGYAGHLARLVRVSDAATMLLDPAAGSDWPDWGAVDAWAGAQGYKVDLWYDQSGLGNHMTQTTAGSRPTGIATFDIAGKRGLNSYGAEQMNTPAGLVLDRANSGHFLVTWPKVTLGADAQVFLSYGNGSGGASRALSTGSLGLNDYTGGNSPALSADQFIRNRLQSLGFRQNGADRSFFVEGTKRTISGGLPSSTSMNAGGTHGAWIGYAQGSQMDTFLRVDFTTAPSDADMGALAGWAAGAFPIVSPTTQTRRLVYAQDSFGHGIAARNNLLIQQLGLDLATWDIVNMSTTGRTLATAYANRANDFASYTAARRCILVIEPPNNDIMNTSFASQVAAESAADGYMTTVNSYVSAARTAGFYAVVVPTMIGNGTCTTANFKEYARARYNANVAAGSGYTIAQRAADSRFATAAAASNTTWYNGDTIHPQDPAGDIALGAIDGAAVLAAAV